jgi:hypothetical protein
MDMIYGWKASTIIQVKIEAFARNKAIQVSETCDEFPVLVQVTGAAWRYAEEMSCAGVDVVVALNVRMHEVKEAMVMLVDRLSPNDRLSILFVGRVRQHMELTYMSDHGRGVARLKISELAHSHVHEKTEYVGPVLTEAAKVLHTNIHDQIKALFENICSFPNTTWLGTQKLTSIPNSP